MAQHAHPPAACAKCKSERTTVLGKTSTNPPLQLLRCTACGHVFTTAGSSAGA